METKEQKEQIELLKTKRLRGLFVVLSLLLLGYLVFQIVSLFIR